ncbi:UNVERIFIED_CONTAM: hypothetical protein PYX00_006062 [Menopon gallinae]|uniref:Uncharacterized protein n=1 Tax=Menopon gallinae TaxID=328185 RepID=A0AAW2HTV4_9NEOP
MIRPTSSDTTLKRTRQTLWLQTYMFLNWRNVQSGPSLVRLFSSSGALSTAGSEAEGLSDAPEVCISDC